ncbi:hypothetical protein NX722_28420 [Endozoicomonas gorgoniicola]|uniref:Scaffolding protein n=1 Tax=Endozoicomonas gorgoniicola TaxID=1234144 RepID=A0ABT3N4C7_9GAMM|nr:hypothetical protein [Endozoicomonas gorgoniicola]MCW7556492.1 hypothetical protein [Endozoicomonas gorgoniicola]
MSEEQTVTDQDNQEFSSAFDAFAEGRQPEEANVSEEASASEEATGDQDTAEVDEQEQQAGAGDHTDDQVSEQEADREEAESEAEAGQEAADDTEAVTDDWEQKYKSVNGRVHAYQRQAEDSKRQLSSAQEEIAGLRRQLEAANTQKPDGKRQPQHNAADTSVTDVNGLDLEEVKDYSPEAHSALVQQQSTINQLQEELNALKQQSHTTEQAQQQRVTDDHIAAINAAHPDVSEVVNAPEFASWMDNQPNAVRRINETGSTEDVIWMLDQFKASRTAEAASKKAKVIQNKRNQRLKDAATIPAKTQSTNRDDGLSDFGSAFNHFADKKDRGFS